MSQLRPLAGGEIGVGFPLPLRLEAPPACWPFGFPGTTFLSTRLQEAGLLLDTGDADTNKDLL